MSGDIVTKREHRVSLINRYDLWRVGTLIKALELLADVPADAIVSIETDTINVRWPVPEPEE